MASIVSGACVHLRSSGVLLERDAYVTGAVVPDCVLGIFVAYMPCSSLFTERLHSQLRGRRTMTALRA
jgi:hypothetical protein